MKKTHGAASKRAKGVSRPGDLPAVAAIPAVPDGAQPMDGAAKQGALKVYAEQRAETEQAMMELWEKRAELAKDLGKMAPDPERGKELLARWTNARDVNNKAQALAAYTDDQETLAGHELMTFLSTAVDDIEHVAKKNPQVLERYAKTLTVMAQRREAVAAGIARSKAAKEAAPKPA